MPAQELHHPQRVSALDGVSGAAAAVEAGPVVDVLLNVAAVAEALPGAEAWRRDRPVGAGDTQAEALGNIGDYVRCMF